MEYKKLWKNWRKTAGVDGDYLDDRDMRIVIQDQNSSGFPQGSVLGPIIFVIYVNDINEVIDSYMNLFADDAKLMRRVENVNDSMVLQDDLIKINKWSKSGQMEFNLSKCKVMEFGKSKKRIQYHYEMDDVKLKKSKEEVDLGVTVAENLTLERHIDKITGETMNLLKRVKMAFSYLDEGMIKKLIFMI